jgi:hypothetical protein
VSRVTHGALAALALLGCGGPSGPVVTLHREITSGQVYGLGFEVTTITVGRPEHAERGIPFALAVQLSIEQHGASPARPVESRRELALRGTGCAIEWVGRRGDQRWEWRVTPEQAGSLRLELDLSGLPGPLKSCQLDGRYVACETIQQLELMVEVE